MAKSRRQITIGAPRPQDEPHGLAARPSDGKRWFFVKGHPRPVFLTGSEPYIRTWPDGSAMEADGRHDTLRSAEARRSRPAAPARAETEVDDG